MRVLFITKFRDGYSSSYTQTFATGLLNSARFVAEMLNSKGVESKLVVVNDNNDIDREVSLFKPTHVMIEAFWVVPHKFRILTQLHPEVEWVIRNHSELPFLASEGIAIDWILQYVKYPKVRVASNSPSSYRDIKSILSSVHPNLAKKLLYLPNYYTITECNSSPFYNRKIFNIGCFGAIRPLKNQLIQATAACAFAESQGKYLFFHINASRKEQKGDQALRNIRAIFDQTPHASLVEHGWLAHDQFVLLMRQMDICMCASLTETFCIVAADAVDNGIPVVGMRDIFWTSPFSWCNPTSTESIKAALWRAYQMPWLSTVLNRQGLRSYLARSERAWLQALQPLSR